MVSEQRIAFSSYLTNLLSAGRVVFSRNRYSGNLKVVRVDYNPSETGVAK